jgi:hypothetical protein
MVCNYGGYGSFVGFNLCRSIAVMTLTLIHAADILVPQFLRMLMMGGRRLGFPSIALLCRLWVSIKRKIKVDNQFTCSSAVNLVFSVRSINNWSITLTERDILMGIIGMGSITIRLDILRLDRKTMIQQTT